MKGNHSERHKVVGELMAYRARVDSTQSSYQDHLVPKITDIQNDSSSLSLAVELLRNLEEHGSFHEEADDEHMARSTYLKTTFDDYERIVVSHMMEDGHERVNLESHPSLLGNCRQENISGQGVISLVN